MSKTFGGNSVDTYLFPSDISRLAKVFEDGIQSNDLQTLFYSALNQKSLSQDEQNAACGKILDAYNESKLNVSIKAK